MFQRNRWPHFLFLIRYEPTTSEEAYYNVGTEALDTHHDVEYEAVETKRGQVSQLLDITMDDIRERHGATCEGFGLTAKCNFRSQQDVQTQAVTDAPENKYCSLVKSKWNDILTVYL